MLLEFFPLDEKYPTTDFDCGEEDLDLFLKNHALTNQNRRLSSTVVASSRGKLIGYYTLAPAQVEREEFPKKLARGLPKYPIPAIRLSRLAVDKRFQGRGLGEELLVHALMKCQLISKEIGGYVVIVDAINQSAKQFYLNYGFQEFPGHPLFLYIRVKDLGCI